MYSVQRNYFKISVHVGWITDIRFNSEMCSVISAGVDGKTYFINMRLREGEKVAIGKVFKQRARKLSIRYRT